MLRELNVACHKYGETLFEYVSGRTPQIWLIKWENILKVCLKTIFCNSIFELTLHLLVCCSVLILHSINFHCKTTFQVFAFFSNFDTFCKVTDFLRYTTGR